MRKYLAVGMFLMCVSSLVSISQKLEKLEESTEATISSIATDGKIKPWYGLCPRQAFPTLENFRQTVFSTPALAERYREFKWYKARVIYARNEIVHAAFQRNGVTGFTALPSVFLSKGETLFTDRDDERDEGSGFLVRGVCCNELKFKIARPSLNVWEPPPDTFNFDYDPVGNEVIEIELGGNHLPAIHPAPTIQPESPAKRYVKPTGPPELPPFPFNPPTPVPEPSTNVLLAIGLVGVFLLKRFWRR